MNLTLPPQLPTLFQYNACLGSTIYFVIFNFIKNVSIQRLFGFNKRNRKRHRNWCIVSIQRLFGFNHFLYLYMEYKHGFNTTLVWVQPFLLIAFTSFFLCFNTTLVWVQPLIKTISLEVKKRFQYNACLGSTIIEAIIVKRTLMFQYNACLGSTILKSNICS